MTEERIGGEETTGKKKPKKSLKRELMEDIIMIVFVLITVWVMKNYVLINAVIPSASMEDTIMTGDRIFGSRLSYEFGEPQRGDIAIFKFPDDESQLYIKRVIGLPGDTIDIEDGKIYINGSAEPLQEDYLKEEWTVATGPYTFEVPEGSYFMMGDNRNDSWDARYWSNTYVTKDKILGKALFTYWPFAHFGKLE